MHTCDLLKVDTKQGPTEKKSSTETIGENNQKRRKNSTLLYSSLYRAGEAGVVVLSSSCKTACPRWKFAVVAA